MLKKINCFKKCELIASFHSGFNFLNLFCDFTLRLIINGGVKINGGALRILKNY